MSYYLLWTVFLKYLISCFQWLKRSFSLCSTVHTVSALEHPLSAVLKDVLNSTITPAQGQPGPFRISEVSRFSAQNTMNWLFTNVRQGYP